MQHPLLLPSPAAAMIWRWIPTIEADGPTQMAIDRWMFQQFVDAGSGPMLRLYRWSRPTLSLGAHQRRLPDHWQDLAADGRIAIVRRPSGGRAVLHGGDLSYALVMRPRSTRRAEAYAQACRWLQDAFAGLGQPLGFGNTSGRQAMANGNCFASSSAADLVDGASRKRIGSAQLWRGQALLQHGSILLAPPAALWRQVFEEDPPVLPGLPCDPSGLERQLRRSGERHLCGGPLKESPLEPRELEALSKALVSVGGWSQDSLLACMARATGARAMPRG
jgi:lipoate-protein ligase A